MAVQSSCHSIHSVKDGYYTHHHDHHGYTPWTEVLQWPTEPQHHRHQQHHRQPSSDHPNQQHRRHALHDELHQQYHREPSLGDLHHRHSSREDLHPPSPDDHCQTYENAEEQKQGSPTRTNYEVKEIEEKEPAEPTQKHSQIAATLNWLNANYERSEGVCLPRCVLYTHYLDFCKKFSFRPAGAATFGKIIRQKFPKLTTRRLGTRGQSKYHYYGIGIKESSIYYHSVYSGRGLTRFSGTKMKTEGSNRKYSLSSKTGTLLPEFPDVDNLILAASIDTDKMKTFMMMYRTHCQRILDTIITANFEEVESFLLHFWQGMPDHLISLLDTSIISDVIALCDSILYKVLIDVLIPSTIQDMPESLGVEIESFIRHLPMWLEISLEDTPCHIQTVKLQVSRSFIQSVKRQLSFVHLAQTARSVLKNLESITNMVDDLTDVDLKEISDQAAFVQPADDKQREVIFDSLEEFLNLLNKQATVESFTEWMDELIERCVLQFPTKQNGGFHENKAADFLLQWSLIGSLIMRDLTLHSASSFGSFHLLHMMLDEYTFLVLETQHELIREHTLQTNLQKHMKTTETIKMVSRVRAGSQSNSSPKAKKRKMDTRVPNDVNSSPELPKDCEPHEDSSISDHGVFIRPIPLPSHRDVPYCYSTNYYRSLPCSPDTPFTPPRPYQTFNNGVFERPYLPQFGVSHAYPDYINNSSSFSSQRLSSTYHQEPHSYHGQNYTSYPALARSLSPVTSSYWSPIESRPFPVPIVPESINEYSYGSVHDGYKKSGYTRSGIYPESVESSLPVSAFSSTVDSSQYIYDRPFYQDDCYSNNMSSGRPAYKHYITQNTG